ncbi:hypothetical protein HPP92_022389 [Vanilla planifolia]|uniref:Serine acetyltransferase N-terminal domain-containing protein n=1 Tax=Vanilla planifolia TaxID=51239 RepID=A0A835PS38_VANPL|nr:hypothetical protein HPP92_022389 [Vanilla planifolia]
MSHRNVTPREAEGEDEVSVEPRVPSTCSLGLVTLVRRSEKIFPIYARGSPMPGKGSLAVPSASDSAADPVWDAIRAVAKSETEKEPILSSFLYASILSHDCLERALGFVLANRLQDPTLLAAQLVDIFENVMMNDKGVQLSIRLDLQAFKDRDPACASYSWALLYLKGYHSLQSYRVAHALWNQGRRVLALALQSRISEVFGVDIHPAAKIGEGILLDHATGLVVGETAVVGNMVSLMQANKRSSKELFDVNKQLQLGSLSYLSFSTSIEIFGAIGHDKVF